MSDTSENRFDSIVDQQLRHMRGEGPKPDLSALTEEELAHALELLDVVDALADSLPASPDLRDDPVAIRLGLVATSSVGDTGSADNGRAENPVWMSAAEVSARFGGLTVQIEPLQKPLVGSGGRRAALLCRSLAEVVLVVVFDNEQAVPIAGDAHEWFRMRLDLSAVAFCNHDATRASVVTPGEAGEFLVPSEGWRSPGDLWWEPLVMALGRHLERSLPRWDEVTALPQGDVLDDLVAEAGMIATTVLGEVGDARPQLSHKRHARDFVANLDVALVVTWLDEVRTRQTTGAELADHVSEMCRAEAS